MTSKMLAGTILRGEGPSSKYLPGTKSTPPGVELVMDGARAIIATVHPRDGWRAWQAPSLEPEWQDLCDSALPYMDGDLRACWTCELPRGHAGDHEAASYVDFVPAYEHARNPRVVWANAI